MNANSMTEQIEAKMVQDAFQHLIDSYLATKHRKRVDVITKAFNFARHAHKGVRRLSGEPYIMHPLAVAQIVCSEIGLGSTSICCALLHDVVEDTDYTVEDIANMFGPKIAQIVDGLTKISGGIFGNHDSAQAENFKKLLLTMSDDVRVILIKIADRLHNMRTLGAQIPSKRYKIAGETLYIYAPLAHRLGLNSIKTELEDLSFKYEHPDDYAVIEHKLASTQAERDTVFDEFTAPIRAQLDALGLKYTIKQRIKSPYSIWRKMQNKHIPFEEIYDILAVRVIFEPTNVNVELNQCFDIYCGMCKIYTSHPDRLRDWVSRPKSNGYQALHVTLMSNKGEWIEVQIRSQRMDELAEKGFAAHWKYKEGEKSETAAEQELEKWLTTIKEILDDPQPDAMDFLDTIKLNLFASEIFVFTPKGELRTMPAGSTALDFAFTIHTFVGSHCIGAKVNHNLVPMSYVLQSGDQVEVLTSKKAHPTREWLNMVTTAKATTKILAVLRREEREAQKRGEQLVDEFFQKFDLVKDSLAVDKLCKYHDCTTLESLCQAVGEGGVTLQEADAAAITSTEGGNKKWFRIFSFGKSKDKKNAAADSASKTPANPASAGSAPGAASAVPIDRKKTLVLNDESIRTQYHLSECCKPIPGDAVMGFIEDDNSITIHKLQCPVAERLKSSFGNRVLGARWEVSNLLIFPVDLHIRGIDVHGILHEITEVISKLHSLDIRKLSIESKAGVFECNIQLCVHDVKDIKELITNLRNIPEIKEVSRD